MYWRAWDAGGAGAAPWSYPHRQRSPPQNDETAGEILRPFRLWNTAQIMGDVFDEYMGGAGGTRYEYFVFLALDRHPQANQREIARAVGVDAATLTHHLNAMARRGLISRERDAEDRRVQRIILTPAGQDLRAALYGARDRYNAEQLEGLGAKETAFLADILERIAANSRRMSRPADGP